MYIWEQNSDNCKMMESVNETIWSGINALRKNWLHK